MLRILRGCYALPQPYWLAGGHGSSLHRSPGIADLALRSWAAREQEEARSLPRYGTPMYPGEDLRSRLIRMTHVQAGSEV